MIKTGIGKYLITYRDGGKQEQLKEVKAFLKNKLNFNFNREEEIDSGLENWKAIEIFDGENYLHTYEYKIEKNGDMSVKFYY